MRYLLCCTLVPAKYEVEIKEISNASNRLLTNLCAQLEKKDSLRILSYIGVGLEPTIQKDISTEGDKDSRIDYFFRSKRIVKGIVQMLAAIWREMKNCDYAVTYNVVYAWMLTPMIAKLMKKKSLLILADYSPIESYTGKVQRLYAKIQQYFISKYDCVIGLSENTKKYLKPNQKFMCMEGGIDSKFYESFQQYHAPKREAVTLMYSGILEKVTGIDLLVKAFEQIDLSNVRLVVTGEGSLREWMEQVAETHTSISYLGCVPYEEYMRKLQQADILINPRNMNLPENANNFPSKIMEYLATGKKIISTKFPGWERYKEYVSFCESEVEAIREILIQAVNEVEDWKQDKFQGNRGFAQKFIWQEQVEAIRKFMLPENQ